MKVTYDKKKSELTIVIPTNKAPFPASKSGKTSMIATSGGNQTSDCEVAGKDGNDHNIVVGLNAFIKDQG